MGGLKSKIIKGSIGVVLVVVAIFACYEGVKWVKINNLYSKGIAAEKNKKYMTAMTQFEKVVKEQPNSKKGLEHLFLAQANNSLYGGAFDTYDRLRNLVDIKSTKYASIRAEYERLTKMVVMSDETKKIYTTYSDNPTDLENALQEHSDNNPKDPYALYDLASLQFTLGKYQDAKMNLQKVCELEPKYFLAQTLLAATLRELGDYQNAKLCVQGTLSRNAEYYPAYIELSKIELKNMEDAKALKDAKYAYQLYPYDNYGLGALILAYYYNHDASNTDKMLTELKSRKDISDESLTQLESILTGSVKWR